MALFQKRPQLADSIQYYTLSQNKTILLVGLGNIGKEYDGTRHNIGFACLDDFVKRTDGFEGWVEKKDLKCLQAAGRVGDSRVIAIKPTTMMNLSGEAVQAVCNFYKLSSNQVAVIHDELDIDFGHIRTRIGGSAAGNNGIKSIIGVMGEEFGRVRVGIGPKKPARMDAADFVLAHFSDKERSDLPKLYREASAILSEFVYGASLPHETRSFLI